MRSGRLGFWQVFALAVGLTVGGGVFVFSGLVARSVGPALPVAYLLAALPVFLSLLPLAMLGAALPTLGGNYRYPSRMVSPGLAFVGVWVYALAVFFGQFPLYALECGRYARLLAPGLPPQLTALAVLSFFYLVNLLGIRLALQLQAVMVALLLAALLYFGAAGLGALEPRQLTGMFSAPPSALLTGVAMLSFTYFGANGVIELGSDIDQPGRVIPRAITCAFALVTGLYLLVALVTVGVLPPRELAASEIPLLAVARATLGPGGLVFFVVCGAILALTTTLHGLFVVGTRSVLAITADQLLPAWWARGHPRLGTPYRIQTGIWALSALGVVTGFSLQTFATYATLGGMLLFGPVLLAALRLPSLYPQVWRQCPFRLSRPVLWLCCGTGLLMVVFFSIVLLIDLGSWLKIGFFATFLLSGGVWFVVRTRSLRARGVDLAALFQADSLLPGSGSQVMGQGGAQRTGEEGVGRLAHGQLDQPEGPGGQQ